jgi:hypothetical protein
MRTPACALCLSHIHYSHRTMMTMMWMLLLLMMIMTMIMMTMQMMMIDVGAQVQVGFMQNDVVMHNKEGWVYF